MIECIALVSRVDELDVSLRTEVSSAFSNVSCWPFIERIHGLLAAPMNYRSLNLGEMLSIILRHIYIMSLIVHVSGSGCLMHLTIDVPG